MAAYLPARVLAQERPRGVNADTPLFPELRLLERCRLRCQSATATAPAAGFLASALGHAAALVPSSVVPAGSVAAPVAAPFPTADGPPTTLWGHHTPTTLRRQPPYDIGPG